MSALSRFFFDEAGQDTVEYTLLLAFVTLTSGALYLHSSEQVSRIWETAACHLSTAQRVGY